MLTKYPKFKEDRWFSLVFLLIFLSLTTFFTNHLKLFICCFALFINADFGEKKSVVS